MDLPKEPRRRMGPRDPVVSSGPRSEYLRILLAAREGRPATEDWLGGLNVDQGDDDRFR